MPEYLIRTTIPSEPKGATSERIVRARNQAQALRHVVADTIDVKLATIDDAMRIAAAGGTVEKARDE